MKLFGHEPALWVGVLASVLSFLVTLNIHGLTDQQAALFVTAVNAVAAVVVAIRTRPIAPAVFTGAVSSVAALAVGYGLHVAPATVGALNLVVLSVLALVTRGQVSPIEVAQFTTQRDRR
jgi:asparagine N-glycosylation enzyme membrane subunit Stt3